MEFWLPFIGTILSTIIIPITNYRQNKKQNEDNNKFKKEIQDESIPKYYLDFAEYNEGKLDKIAIFFMNLKSDIQ